MSDDNTPEGRLVESPLRLRPSRRSVWRCRVWAFRYWLAERLVPQRAQREGWDD